MQETDVDKMQQDKNIENIIKLNILTESRWVVVHLIIYFLEFIMELILNLTFIWSQSWLTTDVTEKNGENILQ